ncbi:MAG: hypothetical protein CMI52_02345 [Parcubacteria group bacterium]|nr:hypothetical protein [Parcubacteria group bacterium]|tara:strand:+ start:57 stop:395 length:339 start_codon:yes stop_codon:yes gene_type:complete
MKREDKKKRNEDGSSDEQKKLSAREELFLLQKRLVEMERKISTIHKWVIWRRIFGWTKVVLIIVIVLGGAQLYKKYFPEVSDTFSIYKTQVDEVFDVLENRPSPEVIPEGSQ